MTRPTCATCWHFDGRHADLEEPDGFCRLRPPVRVGISLTLWPIVNPALDYCAEHHEPIREEPAPVLPGDDEDVPFKIGEPA